MSEHVSLQVVAAIKLRSASLTGKRLPLLEVSQFMPLQVSQVQKCFRACLAIEVPLSLFVELTMILVISQI